MDIEAAVKLLIDFYYKELRPNVPLPSPKSLEYLRARDHINELREEGFSSRDITARVLQLKTQKSSSPPEVDEIFTDEERNEKKYSKNLIEPNKEYYHYDLYIAPPPAKNYFDPELREFVTECESTDYIQKEHYSIDDLLSYFYLTCDIKRCEKGRDRGAMYHLLSQYDLDEILYTILYIRDNNCHVKNAIEISRYIDDGYEYFQRVKEQRDNFKE